MVDRYSDPRKEERHTRSDRELDDPQTERTRRRDVRRSAQDVRSSGADFVSSWCGLWGNLLSSLGDFIASPQSRTRTSSQSTDLDDDAEQRSERGFNCDLWEFSIRCGGTGEVERSRDTSKGERVTARYADRKRDAEVDISSKST